MKSINYFVSIERKSIAVYTLDALTPIIGFKCGALALHFAGYARIEDLANANPDNILRIPHIGKRKLRLIKDFLISRGVDGQIHRIRNNDSHQLDLHLT